MTLADLDRNQIAHITQLPKDLELTAQLLEQGFVPRTEISLAHIAPWKGLMAFRLHNTKVSIHHNVAEQIEVTIAK